MKWLCGYKQKGMFWFRVFGYGISGKDINIHRLLFSEKYGYRKGIQIRRWRFHFIKP